MTSLSSTLSKLACALPKPLPEAPGARLVLLAVRRLGAHGLADARTAEAFLAAFGSGFQRPLILMRGFLADMADAATLPISIAPCCCARMTGAEAAVVDALAVVQERPQAARLLIGDLIGVRHPDQVVASAAALADAFADAGLPF